MHLIDIERLGPNTGGFSLYAIGDLHADRSDFNEARLRAWIKQIASDPLGVAVFVGDGMEGRVPGRKHFDIGTVRADFLANMTQYVNYGVETIANYFRPIVKAKIPLIVVAGNHDQYLEEVNFSVALVQALGPRAHYLGNEGFIRVRSGKRPCLRTTVIYATHGSGGGKKPGAKVNAMQDYYQWVDADVVMAGHVHDQSIRIIPALTVPRDGTLQLVKKPRVMYRAPSFVERAVAGIEGYQGNKSYPTNDEGLTWVRIVPQSRYATRHELELPWNDGDNPDAAA